MKRFTETGKWSKEWFQDLTPVQKCLWFYITENCDAAGVFDGNFKMMSFCIGEKVNAESLEAFGDRIEQLQNGKFWIVDFIEFQYGTISTACRAQNKVFLSIEKNHLSDRVSNKVLDRVSAAAEEKQSDFSNSSKIKSSNTLSDTLPKDTLSNRVSDTQQEEEEEVEEYKDKEKEEEEDIEGGAGETLKIVNTSDVFLSDEEFAGACQYLKQSRSNAFTLMQKNYQKTESEIIELFRTFLEFKIAMNEYPAKTQKDLIDNFYWWLPKRLNSASARQAPLNAKRTSTGRAQKAYNLVDQVKFKGITK